MVTTVMGTGYKHFVIKFSAKEAGYMDTFEIYLNMDAGNSKVSIDT